MTKVFIRSTPETVNLPKEELMALGNFTEICGVVLNLFRQGNTLCTQNYLSVYGDEAGWVGNDEDSEFWLISNGYEEVIPNEEVLI